MLDFGLCSTYDDWPSKPSNESLPKCKKRPPKSSKNEMLVFGLCSTSHDWPSNLSNESQPKCKKKAPLSHQKMKCSFLDYIQLLMIDQVFQAMKFYQNAKKGPLSHFKMKCLFLDYVQFLIISQANQVTKVDQNAKMPPKSSKNEMLVFGLCSTSVDWLSNPSNES